MASRSSSVSTDGTYRLAGWEESTPPPSGAAPTLVADTGVELRVLNATSARKPIDDLTDSTGELAIRREAATAVPADAIEKGSPIPKDSANRRSNDDAEKANRPRGENFLRRILNRLPRRKIKVSDETAAVIDAAAASATASQKSKPIRLKKKRKNRWDLPAWGISAVVHAAVLGSLGAMSLSAEVRSKIMNLNTSMFKDTGGSADELTKIYADQSDGPRDLATGDVSSSTSGSGSGDAPPRSGVALAGGGLGGPSETPRVAAVGKVGARVGGAGAGDGAGLPGGLKIISQVSGLSLLPAAPNRDLGGGGRLAGDVSFATGDLGEALDQLAREILRNLNEHRITVVWLFDESESMRDDQKTIKAKFDRVAVTLREHVDADRKAAGALTHVVVGFGKDVHYVLEKPTADIDKIGRAIDHLRVETSGLENTCTAIYQSINHFAGLISKNRRLLIVLVTDESGDDGASVEEARQAAVSRRVPIYVLGRQALFGFPFVTVRYVDPVTKDVYYPSIHRGPETADLEILQWDGLGTRSDEQPSGFAPYELARLAKDSGGIYFLLPSEEYLRVRRREKAYSMTTLKEYAPDYESRSVYAEKRNRSDVGRTLHEIIERTRSGDFNYRLGFPASPDLYVPVAIEEIAKAKSRLDQLLMFEKRLVSLQPARDRETEKRRQASYDLILAQTVAYEITAYEYMACLKEMVQKRPAPSELPRPGLSVEWRLGHSKERKAPASETEKKYAEANRLIKLVLDRHPNTPWADLARDQLDRGFGVSRHEAKWSPSPSHAERAKFVPHY